MAKYKYVGEDERYFPALGLTVKSGDEFDAPDNLISLNVVATTATVKKAEPVEPIKSAPSDTTLGE